MECDAFESRLLDLALREIEADDASEVRAHVDGCPSCRATLAKLERAQRLASHLPLVEPPATLDAKILAAARAKVGATEPTRAAAPAESVWGAFLRFLSTFATGPQVAMATVMLLVVTIGIWYVPRLRTPATGGTVVDVDPGGEVGPSSGVEPSPRLELQLDPHARRIRSREEAEAQANAPSEARRAEDGTIEAGLQNQRTDLPAQLDESAQEIAEAPSPEPPPPPAFADGEGGSDSMGYGPVGRSAALGGAASGQGVETTTRTTATLTPTYDRASDNRAATPARRPAPTQPADTFEMALDDQAQQPLQRETTLRSRQESERSGDVAPAAPTAADEANETRAVEQAAAPVPATAAPAGPTFGATAPQSPASMHAAARVASQRGDCAQAISTYATLLSRFPRYPSRGQAMVEAAECYARIGQRAEATRMLQRAERIPASATSARRARARIQAAPANATVSD